MTQIEELFRLHVYYSRDRNLSLCHLVYHRGRRRRGAQEKTNKCFSLVYYFPSDKMKALLGSSLRVISSLEKNTVCMVPVP